MVWRSHRGVYLLPDRIGVFLPATFPEVVEAPFGSR